MIQEFEIRAHFAAFASGAISLEDFEDWLDGASWNMHADSAPSAIRLASSALLLFSEFGLGYRNQASLRSELVALINNIDLFAPVNVPVPQPRGRFSSVDSAPWLAPVRLPVAA